MNELVIEKKFLLDHKMCSANNERSEYEKIRLNNIKEREALFKQLGIQELKNDASASTVKKPKSVAKRSQVTGSFHPTRKSRRLVNLKIAHSDVPSVLSSKNSYGICFHILRPYCVIYVFTNDSHIAHYN